MPQQPSLTINGRRVYFAELLDQSYRDTISLDGYEARTLEFCANWLQGIQEIVVHTSGSTGIPKPITLKREQLEASARITCDFFKLQKGDKVLVCLNTEFIGGLMMLVRALMQELEMTIIDPVGHPLELIDPEVLPFDFLSFVPYQLETILQGPEHALRHLDFPKAILLGGAPLTPFLEQTVQQLKVPVYHSYGMTETCSHIALRKVNNPGLQHFFYALPGVELSLDERGCLAISGPMTCGETVQTNDLAELQEDNSFRLLGRADEVINSGGVKVHPALVEPVVGQVLLQQGISCRYIIAGLPHKRLGQEVTLVLERTGLPERLQQEILARLAEQLPKFEAPRRLVCVPNFPETSSGKTDKRRLAEKLAAPDVAN